MAKGKNLTSKNDPGPDKGQWKKNKILDAALSLVAQKGVAAVSIRDIARESGIQISSIYYYFESKEVLLQNVLSYFESRYRLYFDWLTGVNQEAKSLPELLDNMFSEEFLGLGDSAIAQGMSLVIKEQHTNKMARQYVLDLLFNHSLGKIQAFFDNLVKKGAIPPSNTKMIAAIYMFGLIICNELRLHKATGVKSKVDSQAIYNDLKQFMTSALTCGCGLAKPIRPKSDKQS